jgi:hypothetical protein
LSLPYLQPYFGLSNSLQTAQAAAGGAAASGGWVELARTTLGSGGDLVSVASLPDKRYYMILGDYLPSSNFNGKYRFNNDSGSNYARRNSGNGASDSTAVSQTEFQTDTIAGNNYEQFDIGYVSNLASKEKLIQMHTIKHDGNGAGTPVKRIESVGKWSNTSDAINRIDCVNAAAGSFASGSECVVLGWDPADTHSTNFWEELASVSGDGSSTTLSTGTFTAKKYLWVQAYLETTGQMKGKFRVGNGSVDGAGTYSFRINNNGGSDAAHTVKGSLTDDMPNALHHFVNIFAINNASNEGLFIGNDVGVVTTGAGTAPIRQEFVAKWANTSNQFNILDVVAGAGDGNWSSKSILKVWGAN